MLDGATTVYPREIFEQQRAKVVQGKHRQYVVNADDIKIHPVVSRETLKWNKAIIGDEWAIMNCQCREKLAQN